MPTPGAPPPGTVSMIPNTTIHLVRDRPRFGRLVLALIVTIMLLGAVFIIGSISGIIGLGVLGVWIGGSSFDAAVIPTSYRSGGGDTIAVMPIEGVIDGRRAEFARLCANRILDDQTVKAVVLRVDSPGGGVTASDQIWYQVERLRQRGLPVVASFGGIAASGGYYVSCGADQILAEETCTTGSIGVIAQIMTLEGLTEKIGIEPVTLIAANSPEKDAANDIFRAWNERDREKVQHMIDAAYDTFFARVESGRNTTITSDTAMAAIADGSIFTAPEAKANGLVDGIGYLDDAITLAETLAGLPTGGSTVTMWRERPTLFPGMPLAQSGSGVSDLLDAKRLRTFVNELGAVELMYLRP